MTDHFFFFFGGGGGHICANYWGGGGTAPPAPPIPTGLLMIFFFTEIEIREVTWYLWVVGVCATAFLMLIILSAVLPYYMWKHRVILIMKIVHYFQPYEDDGMYEGLDGV